MTNWLRLLMVLYLPFLFVFWLALAGLIVLFTSFVVRGSFFPIFWYVIIAWLGFTLVSTLWAARVLLRPIPPHDDPMELRVPQEGIAELWQLTKQVAANRDLPLPDEIRLSAASVAHVYEDDRDRRILVLGGLALSMLSEKALGGVIAHELGHFGAGDTTLSRRGHKQACLMGELEGWFAVQRWSMCNPLVWLLRGYHWLFLAVQRAHSREQEFAADRHDTAQAGKQESAASLIYLDVLDELPWTRMTSVAESHAATGQPLDKLFAEQRERARSIRRTEWEDAMARALRKETLPLDTHPCLRDRLKAVGVSPKKALTYALEGMGSPIADRLRAWPGIEKRLTAHLMLVFQQMQQSKMDFAQIVLGGPVGR